MTDKELLSAYIVYPLGQSKTPLIAYALPISDTLLRLYNIAGIPLRIIAIQDLYTWALSCNVCVEPPILSDTIRYTEEDDIAYNRLLDYETMEDARRKADITRCINRLHSLFG